MVEYTEEVAPVMTVAPNTESEVEPTAESPSTEDELVLEPPKAIGAVSLDRAASTIKIDEATAAKINTAVASYVESLTNLEAQSPEFSRKVASISRMGNDEMRRSAEASSRFLERPTSALKQGQMTQGSKSRARSWRCANRSKASTPVASRRRGFFRSAVEQSSSTSTSAATSPRRTTSRLSSPPSYRGQDELLRDNAALEQEKVHLWQMKGRLEQYTVMAGALDDALPRQDRRSKPPTPTRPACSEDALFYVRQKRQDLLTQSRSWSRATCAGLDPQNNSS
jgi:uncharacterized protein YaaN involved in tellurite resistance